MSAYPHNYNEAASQARGKYLVILESKTIVLPGWLGSLYKTIEADPSIVMIGSKLICPDGHIKEAGWGILADGEAIRISNDNPDLAQRLDPILNIRRETDHISSSSMMIRRSFWNKVGGLDANYQNKFYGFSDLAMSARSIGKHVVYEPKSETIIFDNQDNDLNSHNNLYLLKQDKVNFFDKWHDELQRFHLPSGSEWYRVSANAERREPVATRKRRETGKLNILYFSPFPSHPSNHGNQSTIQQFAKRFQSMGHNVHFVLLQSSMYNQEDEQAMRNVWDSLEIINHSKPLLSDGNSISFDSWYEQGLGERIRMLCAKYDIDIVFCSYIFHSKLLEFVPDYILKVIDTHDKMGNRYEMLKQNGQPVEFFSCPPEEEGAYLRRADVVIARRLEEATYFDTVSGLESAIVIPHLEESKFIMRNFDRLKNVGLIASANRINLAIIREFLEILHQRLINHPCSLLVHVAGEVKNMVHELPIGEQSIFKQPWVIMHGFIPDIDKFYNQMDVIVSPVTMGTGINVKTVQAMAFGMPLLTTKCGSKGIETGDSDHEHKDLGSLVTSLLLLNNNPAKLNRLSELSRNKYQSFYEEGLSMFRKLFNHGKLSNNKTISNTSKIEKVLLIENNRKVAEERIYEAIWNYYKKGDKSYCFTEPTSSFKMDGTGSEDWIKKTIRDKKIHDEDYLIFKLFSNKNGVIFDIGANWGYSVASIWAMAPETKIISFEPIQSYNITLEKIRQLYGKKYDFRMIGLGSSNNIVKFAVPVINGVALSALTSGLADRNEISIKSLSQQTVDYAMQSIKDPSPIEFSIFEFVSPIRRIDDLILEDVNLLNNKNLMAMKIDAEGLDGDILRGSEKTLHYHKPVVMLEGGNRYEGLTEYMKNLGYAYYELNQLNMSPVDGVGLATNGFFFHSEHPEKLSGNGIFFN